MTQKFRYDLEFDEDTHWRLVRLGALNKVQHEDFLESIITSTIETLAMDEEEEESTQTDHIPDATKMVPVATDEELRKLWLDLYTTNDGPTSGEVVAIARAVLERWGNQATITQPRNN